MAGSDSRRRLIELKDVVKVYFELTGSGNLADRWDDAFQAIRRDDLMARDFVTDLKRLIEHIEREFPLDAQEEASFNRSERPTVRLPRFVMPGAIEKSVANATKTSGEASAPTRPPVPSPGGEGREGRRFGPAREDNLRTVVSAPPQFDDEPTARTVLPSAPPPGGSGTKDQGGR